LQITWRRIDSGGTRPEGCSTGFRCVRAHPGTASRFAVKPIFSVEVYPVVAEPDFSLRPDKGNRRFDADLTSYGNREVAANRFAVVAARWTTTNLPKLWGVVAVAARWADGSVPIPANGADRLQIRLPDTGRTRRRSSCRLPVNARRHEHCGAYALAERAVVVHLDLRERAIALPAMRPLERDDRSGSVAPLR
jgi:hypothetical protein